MTNMQADGRMNTTKREFMVTSLVPREIRPYALWVHVTIIICLDKMAGIGIR